MHPPVRALSRGLTLLSELNAGGPSSAQELSRITGENRTTIYRLLDTLCAAGFVAFDKSGSTYSVTPQVRQLSDGVTVRDAASQAALPAMFDLMGEVKWPSDFAVFDDGAVLIRESTHPYSPLSVHRAMTGRRRPLLRSALGRAIIAAAEPSLRREMMQIAAHAKQPDAALAEDKTFLTKLVRQVEQDGYSSSVGETEDNISAIALPICNGRNVIGAMNIIFFKTSLTPAIAAQRYLTALRRAVTVTETSLSGMSP